MALKNDPAYKKELGLLNKGDFNDGSSSYSNLETESEINDLSTCESVESSSKQKSILRESVKQSSASSSENVPSFCAESNVPTSLKVSTTLNSIVLSDNEKKSCKVAGKSKEKDTSPRNFASGQTEFESIQNEPETSTSASSTENLNSTETKSRKKKRRSSFDMLMEDFLESTTSEIPEIESEPISKRLPKMRRQSSRATQSPYYNNTIPDNNSRKMVTKKRDKKSVEFNIKQSKTGSDENSKRRVFNNTVSTPLATVAEPENIPTNQDIFENSEIPPSDFVVATSTNSKESESGSNLIAKILGNALLNEEPEKPTMSEGIATLDNENPIMSEISRSHAESSGHLLVPLSTHDLPAKNYVDKNANIHFDTGNFDESAVKQESISPVSFTTQDFSFEDFETEIAENPSADQDGLEENVTEQEDIDTKLDIPHDFPDGAMILIPGKVQLKEFSIVIKRENIDSILCNVCDKFFTAKIDLQIHQMLYHTETVEDYGCLICHKKFSSTNSLKEHNNRNHATYYIKECDLCHKMLRNNCEKRRHMIKMHGGEFDCKKCSFRAISRQKLNLHMKSHLIKCRVCQLQFSEMKVAHRHENTHFEKEKFKCEPCDMEFELGYDYSLHKLSQHFEKPYECKFCQTKFSRKLYLEKHEKSCFARKKGQRFRPIESTQ